MAFSQPKGLKAAPVQHLLFSEERPTLCHLDRSEA
jgi:hypothetical protein